MKIKIGLDIMDEYKKAISQIIKKQKTVMGPVALDLAKNVKGLDVSNINSIQFKGDANSILNSLVNEYSNLFGQAAIEVCKDAIKETRPPISADSLPSILK